MAAGGGGASSNASSQSSDFDARGLLYPRKDYRNSIKVTDLRDDAGNFGRSSLYSKTIIGFMNFIINLSFDN